MRPYGLAKKMMLVQGQSYREQYGFNTIFLLPANLYGPRDHFDPEISHVIPALISKCIAARESGAEFVEAWGTGNASREFLYVADCAEAVVAAAAVYNESEPVNIGTGNNKPRMWKRPARLTTFRGESVGRVITGGHHGVPGRLRAFESRHVSRGDAAARSCGQGEWYEPLQRS